MRAAPILWLLSFGVATIVCGALAVVSDGGIGAPVRPHRGDGVVYLLPRKVGSCTAGQVATGRVAGFAGDTVALGANTNVGGQLERNVVVNGRVVARVTVGNPSLGAETIPNGHVFIVGRKDDRACRIRLLEIVPSANVVGYTQGALDARVAIVRSELRARVTAEKYVAAVYALVVAFWGLWLVIHASRIFRMERQLTDLLASGNDKPERAGA